MDHITWPNRGEPAQLIHPNAQQGVRPERSCVPSQAHRHCRRVPARGSKPLKGRTLRRSLVKMIRLWIELGGKALDVFPAYMFFRALEAHPDVHIFEPLDHGPSPHACATCALTTAPSMQRPREDQRRRDAGHGTDGMRRSPCLAQELGLASFSAVALSWWSFASWLLL